MRQGKRPVTEDLQPQLAPDGEAPESNAQARRWRRLSEIGPGWISAVGTLLAAIIAGLGLLIAQYGGSQPTSSSPATVPGRIALAPATTAPVVDECSARLQIGADGNAGPLTCGRGKLNVLAWQYFAKNNPLVMSLGPNVIPDQVLRAMCSDLHAAAPETSTVPIEISVYRLSALYYGWQFGVDPVQEFLGGNC
jgi:hypothetical protein